MKSIELENLKSKDLIYFGERIEPYFCSQAIISGMQNTEKSIKLFGLKTIIRWLQVNYYYYQFISDVLRIETEIMKKLKENGNQYVNKLIEKCLKAGIELQKKSIHLGTKANSLVTKKEMAKAVLEYKKAVSDYTIFYQITFFERPEMEIIEEMVKKYAKTKDDAQKLFDLITVTNQVTTAEYEQDDFLRIAASDEEKREKLAEKHAKKYGWLSVRYFIGNAWTKNDVLKRLRGIDKAYAKNELEARPSYRREREKLICNAIKNFTKEDKKLVQQVRKVVFLRTQRGDFVHESAAHIRPLLNKISAKLGVEYLDLLNLSAQEIALSLEGKIDYKMRINNRKKNFLIYHNLNKSEVLEDKEVEVYLDNRSFLKVTTENVTEFTGQVGYKGKIQGIIKIIKINSDMEKVQRGDIIVTSMTTSNFLPALEKASAFITDEGGVTCHAAIIAREMRKPCIIGTKIATKVLKDGDLVEVDANKGVIKILKNTA